MTRDLRAERRGPPVGQGRNLVVFVHGYGANGADLIELANPLAPHLPGTVFLAPDAPERCAASPFGLQWFPIPWLDGSSDAAAAAGLEASAADLDAFLDATLRAEGIAAANTILFGFSQGTMLSLHVAPRRAEPVAGIVAFSGRLIAPEQLAAEAVSRPPVLLVHGDADEVVPPQSLPEAGKALQAAGFEVYAHVMRGTGHGIAPDGLSVALAFMRDRLGA
ncbi:MAG: alpha/beta fold hydrolase [Paracoccaceae bacterium]|nr:alpha/beta fold hydrolase [Paracoccaceae bacterium]